MTPYSSMKLGLNSLGRYPLSVILSFLTETDGARMLLTQRRFVRAVMPLFRLPRRLQIMGCEHPRLRFQVIPVQDPETLLERLNTRRLYKRQTKTNGLKQRHYVHNKTTDELAKMEWKAASRVYPPYMELLRFLDGSEEDWGGVTLLASYPRSGNTLLRTLLERVTGVVTGADTRPDRPLSKELALNHDLVGEGVTQRVRVVKTHYPERQGHPVHTGHRAILLVRNPYDVIDSYWNFNLTRTHTETVTDEVYERFSDMFSKLAVNELGTWMRFHQYWWKNVEIPVLLVRFEDLIMNPEQELGRIIPYIINQPTLSDFWAARIRYVCRSSSTTGTLGSYQPRSATGGKHSIGKSLHKGRYSQELIQQFEQVSYEYDSVNGSNMLCYFGYDVGAFPSNFAEHRAPKIVQEPQGGSATSMTVNNGPMIRPANDPYGRAMRQWRHSHTNKDTNPFPTVSKTEGGASMSSSSYQLCSMSFTTG